ncbi:hypothetical protein CROQUDRAFT_98382 [Cronartium quercuum f. sp. fusiforme G11]|uniref:Uncharacterized protein n=1 Tax=Cronartium quercuum f. sp. fusiforme G11 TaxID=708437 RepID=A0A9P6T8R4_9BASI|nr:hypothetical protein CROQUDRAFT_98382 [Cronartium quercuum f. sp. fusiforme G11]
MARVHNHRQSQNLDDEANPKRSSSALFSHHAQYWKKAVYDEYDSFLANNVFEICE